MDSPCRYWTSFASHSLLSYLVTFHLQPRRRLVIFSETISHLPHLPPPTLLYYNMLCFIPNSAIFHTKYCDTLRIFYLCFRFPHVDFHIRFLSFHLIDVDSATVIHFCIWKRMALARNQDPVSTPSYASRIINSNIQWKKVGNLSISLQVLILIS